MSRIGKRVLSIPENVNVNVDNNIVTVKGPKGELTLDLVKGINVKVEDNTVVVEMIKNDKFTHAMQFQKDKTHKSNYLLKEPDLNLELNIKTKELDIKEDKIYIKYEILESNNIFEYKIELEDIL